MYFQNNIVFASGNEDARDRRRSSNYGRFQQKVGCDDVKLDSQASLENKRVGVQSICVFIDKHVTKCRVAKNLIYGALIVDSKKTGGQIPKQHHYV